jgi:hypothetical protein
MYFVKDQNAFIYYNYNDEIDSYTMHVLPMKNLHLKNIYDFIRRVEVECANKEKSFDLELINDCVLCS